MKDPSKYLSLTELFDPSVIAYDLLKIEKEDNELCNVIDILHEISGYLYDNGTYDYWIKEVCSRMKPNIKFITAINKLIKGNEPLPDRRLYMLIKILQKYNFVAYIDDIVHAYKSAFDDPIVLERIQYGLHDKIINIDCDELLAHLKIILTDKAISAIDLNVLDDRLGITIDDIKTYLYPKNVVLRYVKSVGNIA